MLTTDAGLRGTDCTDDEPDEFTYVAIGTTSALRRMTDEDAPKLYERYRRQAAPCRESENLEYDLNTFKSTFAGWTRLQLYTGWVTTRLVSVLVPREMVSRVGFPSAGSVVAINLNGDLVAARMNQDGFLILDQLLCSEEGETYKQCEKEYFDGVFNLRTGGDALEEDKPEQKRKRNIDPTTLKPLLDGD